MDTLLAIQLFKNGFISLEKAAEMSGLNSETFIDQLGRLGIPAASHPTDELNQELKDFG